MCFLSRGRNTWEAFQNIPWPALACSHFPMQSMSEWGVCADLPLRARLQRTCRNLPWSKCASVLRWATEGPSLKQPGVVLSVRLCIETGYGSHSALLKVCPSNAATNLMACSMVQELHRACARLVSARVHVVHSSTGSQRRGSCSSRHTLCRCPAHVTLHAALAQVATSVRASSSAHARQVVPHACKVPDMRLPDPAAALGQWGSALTSDGSRSPAHLVHPAERSLCVARSGGERHAQASQQALVASTSSSRGVQPRRAFDAACSGAPVSCGCLGPSGKCRSEAAGCPGAAARQAAGGCPEVRCAPL